MKRAFFKMARRLGAAIALCILSSTALGQAGPPCANSLIKGKYGFSVTGSHTGIGNYGMVGTMDVDGAGHINGVGLQSINGNQSDVSFTGTYQVKPDCTGTTELTFEDNQVGHVRFVIVEDGNEILLMDVGAHTVETGSAKRQFYSVDRHGKRKAK